MSGCRAHKRLISADCLKHVEASAFTSVFKQGWLRLNEKFPFLSGADGWLVKGRIASYARVAFLI